MSTRIDSFRVLEAYLQRAISRSPSMFPYRRKAIIFDSRRKCLAFSLEAYNQNGGQVRDSSCVIETFEEPLDQLDCQPHDHPLAKKLLERALDFIMQTEFSNVAARLRANLTKFKWSLQYKSDNQHFEAEVMIPEDAYGPSEKLSVAHGHPNVRMRTFFGTSKTLDTVLVKHIERQYVGRLTEFEFQSFMRNLGLTYTLADNEVTAIFDDQPNSYLLMGDDKEVDLWQAYEHFKKGPHAFKCGSHGMTNYQRESCETLSVVQNIFHMEDFMLKFMEKKRLVTARVTVESQNSARNSKFNMQRRFPAIVTFWDFFKEYKRISNRAAETSIDVENYDGDMDEGTAKDELLDKKGMIAFSIFLQSICNYAEWYRTEHKGYKTAFAMIMQCLSACFNDAIKDDWIEEYIFKKLHLFEYCQSTGTSSEVVAFNTGNLHPKRSLYTAPDVVTMQQILHRVIRSAIVRKCPESYLRHSHQICCTEKKEELPAALHIVLTDSYSFENRGLISDSNLTIAIKTIEGETVKYHFHGVVIGRYYYYGDSLRPELEIEMREIDRSYGFPTHFRNPVTGVECEIPSDVIEEEKQSVKDVVYPEGHAIALVDTGGRIMRFSDKNSSVSQNFKGEYGRHGENYIFIREDKRSQVR